MDLQSKEREETEKALKKASDSLITALQNLEAEKYLIGPENSMMEEEEPEEMEETILSSRLNNLSIFDKIPDFSLDETLETKITNLKMIQFPQKRKEDLFKRHCISQQDTITKGRQKIDQAYNPKDFQSRIVKEQFTLRNQSQNKTETFPITQEDMDKLKPDTDLNDTIIGNYLKMFSFVFLPPYLEDRCFFYSTFFMEKLICEYVRDQVVCDRDPSYLVSAVKEKIKDTYKNVKKWTRRTKIFQLEALVMPINAFKHWFCLIILKPGALLDPSLGRAQILYCDSMCEKREFIVEAIRRYLEFEIFDKKQIKLTLNQDNMPCYQLLLPRQTNFHDCGLYMLSYVEELLSHREELQNLQLVSNRNKLRLFPRALIFTMRVRLRKLFERLTNAQNEEQKNMILVQYKGEKERIIMQTESKDYDQINQKQYKKYEKMNISFATGANQQEKAFLCLIRFYLDPEINFYQKDK